MCRLQLKRLHLITPKKDIKPYIFIFKRSLFTMHLLNAMNSLNTYLINSWTWIACLNIAVCLCPLLYVDLHIGSTTLLSGARIQTGVFALRRPQRWLGLGRLNVCLKMSQRKGLVRCRLRELSHCIPQAPLSFSCWKRE